MNSSNLTKVKFIGMIAIIVLGMVFHELYKSTGIVFFGIISPVNESKWEHWKMAFWPVIFISIFEYYFIKGQVNNYIFSLAVGILVFEIATFGSIEIYDLVFGESHILVHVVTFVAGGIACQFTRYFLMLNTEKTKVLFLIGVLLLLIHIVAFVVFTFRPLQEEYFKDSLSGTYGIFKYKE